MVLMDGSQICGYVFIFLFFASLLFFSGSSNKNFHFAFLFLFLMYVFRAPSVGKDTSFYTHAFQEVRLLPLQDLFSSPIYADTTHTWTLQLEPGYLLFNKILGWMMEENQGLILVTGFVIFALLYHLIQDQSPIPGLSLWLYFTLGIFQTQMNVSRNAIAILICYPIFNARKSPNLIASFALILFVSFFHQSVWLLFPVCFLAKIRLNERRMIGILLVSLAAGLFLPYCGELLSPILPGYSRYLLHSGGKAEAAALGIVHGFLVMMVLSNIGSTQRSLVFEKYSAGMWMFALNLAFLCMSFSVQAASRAAACFGPYLILLIPQILEEIKEEEQKKKAIKHVLIFSGLFYLIRISVNNIGGTMPYQFFFS